MALAVDHVILLARDLDHGARDLLDRHGLAARPGGRHPGHGTGNAIVPLGPDYLEIMSIVDAAEAATSQFGRAVRNALDRGDPFLALSVRTDDVESVARRIGSPVVPLARTRPDGVVLRCRLAGLEAATGEPPLPFFIQWDVPPEQHPGRDAAPHRVTPSGIAWVEFASEMARVARWLGDALPGLRLVAGATGVRGVGIATSDGEVALRV